MRSSDPVANDPGIAEIDAKHLPPVERAFAEGNLVYSRYDDIEDLNRFMFQRQSLVPMWLTQVLSDSILSTNVEYVIGVVESLMNDIRRADAGEYIEGLSEVVDQSRAYERARELRVLELEVINGT